MYRFPHPVQQISDYGEIVMFYVVPVVLLIEAELILK